MREYRLFFKDCLKLNEMAKAEVICLSFNIERDILESANSSFNLVSIPQNVNEGDVVGLVDPYGDILYYGVIESIEDLTVHTRQIESLFNDNWLYRSPNKNTIEECIYDIIDTDFKNSNDPIMMSKYNFNLVIDSQTQGSLITQDEQTVENFEDMIYSFYNSYGVRLYFDIPYSSGTCTITIAKYDYTSLKIGNNVKSITSLIPSTEIQELNKLVIYSSENVYRATYFRTPSGITTNASDPLRLPVVNTEFIFSDDDLDVIVADKLNESMYNHYINFDLILNNKIYDFYSMKLGMPLQIFINQDYYDSIFTGYSLSKEESRGLDIVNIKCGKVRASLTSLLRAIK